MTVYVAFDLLKKGKLSMDDSFLVSEKAWRMQGSKMFVHVGDQVKVEDLLHGIITQSGNDACIVLAEGVAGTEEAFAEMMTKKARELGMKHSTFTNATGWPDPNHLMTARDLSTLARHIIKDFPEYYEFFARPDFTYSSIKQGNRNLLLYRNIGVDGLKTGHTEAGGFGITVSGEQHGHRIDVVVNGLSSDKERADEAQKLFSYGLLNFETKKLFKKGEEVENAEVWYGKSATVPLVAPKNLSIVLPKADSSEVKLSVSYEGPVEAPIQKGQHIADLKISIPAAEDKVIPLVAGEDVAKQSYFGRLLSNVKYRFSSNKTEEKAEEKSDKNHKA
jgi:D-alanyl-D-alanine carboxypeptidase (penicillin-binding protein 5/6)